METLVNGNQANNDLPVHLSEWDIDVMKLVIAASPKGIIAADIAAKLEVKAPALNHRLSYLLSLGLLRREAEKASAGVGRSFRYFALVEHSNEQRR